MATAHRWNKPLNTNDADLETARRAAIAATTFAASKVTVLRGTTIEVIGRIPDETLDFAYLDGDHTLRGIPIDLIKVYPKIKPGGVIGDDDFEPTPWVMGRASNRRWCFRSPSISRKRSVPN
jgi:predicted O-methyltransferase YrrM